MVEHRQQGERATGVEDFPRDMVVRALVREGADDRCMIVFPARGADARGLARRRVAPLGGDQQRRLEDAAVVERDGDAVRGAVDAGGLAAPQQSDALARLRPGEKAGAQVAIFVHPAERFVVAFGRFEHQAARLKPVGDLDRANGAARFGQVIGDADRVEHPPRGRGDRAGAPVELGTVPLGRIDRVDDDGGKAGAVERAGEGEANQPAAEDDDVRAFHVTVSIARRAGLGERLTSESGEAHGDVNGPNPGEEPWLPLPSGPENAIQDLTGGRR